MKIHTGEKPYQYSDCEKVFSKNNDLNSHKMTHTGQKSYQCSNCEKSISKNSDLMSYNDTHPGKTIPVQIL